MLESSFGLTFFLKAPKRKSDCRYIHLRITVDGVPKETSTKRKWNATKWNQKTERAMGNKEDARALNAFLDSLVMEVNQFKNNLMYHGSTITVQKLMDQLLGKTVSKAKVLDEFQLHNDEREPTTGSLQLGLM